MLAIHRKGRRHIAELSKYLLHKRELQLKMQKSSQLLELKASSRKSAVNINEMVTVVGERDATTSLDKGSHKYHPLLTSSPYSSCSKKRKQKIPLAMQRRMILESPKFPPLSSALVIENSEASPTPSAHSEVRRYLKGLQRKKPFSKVVEKMKEGYSLPHSEQASSSCAEESRDTMAESSSGLKVTLSGSDVKPNQEKMLQSALMEHNLKLSMSGWIWDKDVEGGKWVKDPNVEFDSDEDEPPPME
ncbi:sodium channel modifier 1-like isoform X2 [Hetaerina americana]